MGKVAAAGMVCLLVACSTPMPPAWETVETSTEIAWPASPEPARIRYLEKFGDPADIGYRLPMSSKLQGFFAGESNHRMTRPYSIDVNGKYMAVADPGAGGVHLFNRIKQTYSFIDSGGNTRFRSPVGVALGDGKIFVVDSVLGKVFFLDDHGDLLLEIRSLNRPTSLAFDQASNRLFVADTLDHKILAYAMDGREVLSIGERGDAEGQFNFPSHITIAHEQIYVNDTLNFRVQVFDLQGRFLHSLGEHGDTPGYFAQPKGLAVNSEGHVFVAETVSNRIQIFNLDGDYLMDFGHAGEDRGGFRMPAGLSIHDDRIYVADSGNRRIQVFEYLAEP